MSVFKDKTLLITGGTGSFGNAVLNRFLRTDIGEIRIFSRDEKKQDDMRHRCHGVSDIKKNNVSTYKDTCHVSHDNHQVLVSIM